MNKERKEKESGNPDRGPAKHWIFGLIDGLELKQARESKSLAPLLTT
jgi:hypothetical protein